jgi:hypothetical protein
LTDGDKVLLATVKVRAYATRYPKGSPDPENPQNPPTEFYSILTNVLLANQIGTTFTTDQIGFSTASFAGHIITTEIFVGNTLTQSWFFPVKLEDAWDEQASRISGDQVVADGEALYPEENPWDAQFYTLETTTDVVVAFLKQSAAGEPHVLAGISQALLQSIGPVPNTTEIIGVSGSDQSFRFWHSEVQVLPVYNVPRCPPDEGYLPWEPYGFNLTNRDSFGYEPDSDFPGKDTQHLLRNDYPRQVAFMLPFGALMGSSWVPLHTTGETASIDTRDTPPPCL